MSANHPTNKSLDSEGIDRRELILTATLALLSERGISGISMRAVAQQAGVSLGLVNYHFEDKHSLIRATLMRIEKEDLTLVTPRKNVSAHKALQDSLSSILAPRFLNTEYLSLRLQLWSLAQVDHEFADINAGAQARYREGLTTLISKALPDLSLKECKRRAAEIDIIQNGIWLTALLQIDKASLRRSVELCHKIAFDGTLGPS